jgi:hypothetical protein
MAELAQLTSAEAGKLVMLTTTELDLIRRVNGGANDDATRARTNTLLNTLAERVDFIPFFRNNMSEILALKEQITRGEQQLINQGNVLAVTASSLQTALANAATPPMMGPSSPKLAKIPNPPHFEKGRTEYRTFKTKLTQKLRADGDAFPSEERKLIYAMGFLKGQAHEQVAPLFEDQTINSVTTLLEYLDATFEDPDRKKTAERELRNLQQGKNEFSAHYAKFQQLTAVLKWNEEAKKSALESTLSDELKDSLSHQCDTPDSLADLVVMLQKLDGRLKARAAERRVSTAPRPPNNQQSGRQQNNRPSASNPSSSRTPPGRTPPGSSNPRDSWNPRHTGPAPMDLSAKQRSDSKQNQFDRRAAEGNCTNCGKADHWRSECPTARRRFNASGANLTGTNLTEPGQGSSSSGPQWTKYRDQSEDEDEAGDETEFSVPPPPKN